MTANNLSQRISKLSRRLEELKAKCLSNSDFEPEVLADALESLQASIEELSTTEVALRESETRFRTSIKNSNFVLSQFNRDLEYTWMHNPHPDFDASLVIGKRGEDLEDSEGMRRLTTLKRRVVENGEGDREEISFIRSDGVHTYNIIIEPLFNETGDVIGGVTSALDITERKKAEEEIRRAKDKLELRVQERTLELNQAAEKLEVINAKLIDEIKGHAKAEEELKRTQLRLRIAMDLARLVQWEYDVKTDLFTFDDQFYALYGTTAEREGGPLMSSQDYARKFLPSEEASLVAEEIGKAVATTDPNFAGYVEHRIIRDDGTESFIAVRYAAVKDDKGHTIKTFGANQDITERKRSEIELDEYRKHLEELVRERTSELEAANANLHVEINERKRAEEALHKSKDELEQRIQERTADLVKANEELVAAKDAAEEAVRAKAAFLANVSHELRTPMNSIIGFTSLLLEEPLSPEYKDWLENMRMNGEALLALINDVLDFSKMEKYKIELELHPFNLRQLIEESLDLVSKEATEKGLDLAYLMDGNAPETIISDSARLRQVLTNLLSNAVKFTDTGDVLVHVSSKPDCVGHELHFAVQDTGIGMPQDQTSKLFQPFSQIDTSPSRLKEGTGLGLAISRKLVELMGGKIWAESEEGKGSTFIFTIKAKAASEDNKARLPVGPQPLLLKRNVLIVDDNSTIRRLLGHQTKSWGMVPLLVSLSYSAIDLIQKGVTPDVAIIDVGMPDLNGLVLAEKILKIRSDMPLIMLTSVGQRIPERLSAANVTKPIKPMQLYDALTGVLNRRPIREQNQVPMNQKRVSPLRILLAEDNISSQQVTMKMLNTLGYRADVAANGIEVLRALERQPYDVILMDIKMPEMDGYEAAKQIRQRWQNDRPRIIALTAYALEGDRERCLEAGMDDYIAKPVKINELADALSRSPTSPQE